MDFFTFLQDLGIQTPSQQILTRSFTRWGKNSKYYAIAVDSDGGQGFVVGDWSTGETWNWFPKADNEITYEEIQKRRDIIKQAREAEALQREHDWSQAARKVNARLKVLSTGRNGYLDKKGIQGDFIIDGEKVIVPLRDIDGNVWTVQTIDSLGNKKLYPGGKKKGNFHQFGAVGDVIYVCEGFATAWSVHYATSECAIMAVDIHNMKPVVDSLVIKYGKERVVVCADNDGGETGGIGVEKAKELESTYGVRVVVPELDGGKADFNDVFQKNGAKAVRDMLDVKVQRVETLSSKGLSLPDSKDLGLVGEIADWIMKTSIMPQYPLALAASIGFVGMAKGHKVKSESGLRTNMLVLSVAPSGSGKEHPRGAIEHLAEYCGLSDNMAGDPASGTALVDGVFHSAGKQLIQIDEIGRLLKLLANKNATGFQAEILTTIMKMFSSAGKIYRGKQYAKQAGKKVDPVAIDQPCLCVNGSTVPKNLYESMTGEDVVDGFLNRWLLFESKEFMPERNLNVKELGTPPDSIVNQIKEIHRWDAQEIGYGSDMNMSPKPVAVRFNCEAKQMLDKYSKEIDTIVRTMEAEGDNLFPLWQRIPEHITKVALILANDRRITEQNVKSAYAIVMHCVTMMVEAVRANIASNDYERKKQVILRIIKNSGGSAKLRFISPRCNMPAREYKEILATLVEGGILIERKQATGTKPTIVYELV